MACVLTSPVLVLLCVVILAGTRQASCASVHDDDEKRLLMDLFDKYASEIRPVLKKSDNVTIKFGLSLHQIIAVDFKNQIVKSSVWIRQTWYNPYLSWNSSLYGGIKTINVEPSKVWVPDIYLYNNADDSYDGAMDKFKTKVVLNSDGNALWLAPKIISSSCQFDVTYFPFDEQLCILKFGSWTYNGFSLNFINEDFPKTCEGDISKFIMNGEWNLMEMPCQRNEIMYVCCPAPYPDVTYTLHLRRKFLFYFINMIAPCFLISALTLLSFYLPPESGERLTLVITNLLALTVFMLLVVEMIPATSETVPLISIYFYGSVFEVALALIATCLVLRCYFNPSHKPVPSWVRHVVLSWMARLTRVNVKKIKEDARKGNDSKHGSTLELSDAAIRRKEFCARASGSHELDSVTRLNTSSSQGEVSFSRMNRPVRSMSGPLGEISAGISAVTRDDVDMRRNLLSRRMHEPVDCSPLSSRASSFVNIKNECHLHPSAPSKSPLGESLEASILQSNRTLTSSVGELVEFARDQQEMDRQLEEWRMVAIVVDKFFLWVFLLILFVSSIVIFMQAPRYVFWGRH